MYAVISGCVCVILALVLCSFLPLGVQSQSDKLSEITCTALRVVNNRGDEVVRLLAGEYGGLIGIYEENGQHAQTALVTKEGESF